jgi:hypothetical protein
MESGGTKKYPKKGRFSPPPLLSNQAKEVNEHSILEKRIKKGAN